MSYVFTNGEQNLSRRMRYAGIDNRLKRFNNCRNGCLVVTIKSLALSF